MIDRLTTSTCVHTPTWSGTLDEALKDLGDELGPRLQSIGELMGIEVIIDIDGDLLNADRIFDEFFWAGCDPDQIVRDLFDDPDAQIID